MYSRDELKEIDKIIERSNKKKKGGDFDVFLMWCLTGSVGCVGDIG